MDIDGTVALRGARSPYDFTLVRYDKPNAVIVDLVRMLSSHGPIIFVTGRDGSCRKDTEEWLDQHVGVQGPLFMRRSGDTRKDADVKREIFRNEIVSNYTVRLVLDDRNQTVALWRQLGLVCLQVADGNF